jgi:hypothetical protein
VTSSRNVRFIHSYLNEPTKLISTENQEITINCGETAYGKARSFT